MESQEELIARVEEIAERDARYRKEAFFFIFEALAHTVKTLELSAGQRHVSGRQLLSGISEMALDQFGPMVKTVFEHWGVRKTKDFGEIVFLMVNSGLMGKTEEDSVEDFDGVYDFDEEFDWRKAIGQRFKDQA